jgi:hypothetical protein
LLFDLLPDGIPIGEIEKEIEELKAEISKPDAKYPVLSLDSWIRDRLRFKR